MTTRVVHAKREKYDVYIGRPSRWGNPFVMGVDGDRKVVVQKFRDYLFAHPELVRAARKELKGKRLGCFCAPQQCHGDVYVEFIEGVYKDLRPTIALVQREKHVCQGKHAYSEIEAKITLQRLQDAYRSGEKKNRGPQGTYKCDHCGAWHLTTQRK